MAHAGHDHHGHHMPNMSPDTPVASSTVQTLLTTVLAATTAAHTHSGHNPSAHDHMEMDHSGHVQGMSHMMMYFHFGVNETVLFQGWTISTVGGMVGSVIGVFIMAAVYEGLKYLREHLFRLHFTSMHYSSVAVAGQEGHTLTEVHQIVRNRMISWAHGIQTILHMVQVLLSYFLMLVFMTYNVWLCMGIILGAGCGYFIFGWKKATVVDVTDHCH
ncbi:high affinity copper uptake protein 1-like [Ornithodoros turicata]|uniref:high affinity copper uptake protein 1-like n=1 Tax=Ornithodoros turicata TaxID=34597 RepID=UPI003138F9AE